MKRTEENQKREDQGKQQQEPDGIDGHERAEGQKGGEYHGAGKAPEGEDLANEYFGAMDYPLRKPEEDQKWAVNTVRLWLAALSALMIFITVMLVLGAIYD